MRDWLAEEGGGAPPSEQRVGRATGLLSATFSAAQLLTSYPLGRLSDRIGRKPIMLLGNVSAVVSLLAFGLSSSYSQAALARFLGGFFNACIGGEPTISCPCLGA